MSEQQRESSHSSFLAILAALHQTAGASFVKSALIKTGISAARVLPEREFATIEEFIQSIDQLDNPIAQLEGSARHYGNGLFGLPECPFASAMKAQASTGGATGDPFRDITDEMNKPSLLGDELRVGRGAVVSPFCAVHQPIRSAIGERIRVAGRSLSIYQLGCRSPGGSPGLADHWIALTGFDRKLVEQVLVENTCCYCIRFEREN